jgi:hypothetical protein
LDGRALTVNIAKPREERPPAAAAAVVVNTAAAVAAVDVANTAVAAVAVADAVVATNSNGQIFQARSGFSGPRFFVFEIKLPPRAVFQPRETNGLSLM